MQINIAVYFVFKSDLKEIVMNIPIILATDENYAVPTGVLITSIMENAEIDYVITDKEVTISADKKLSGNNSFPVFVPAYQTI